MFDTVLEAIFDDNVATGSLFMICPGPYPGGGGPRPTLTEQGIDFRRFACPNGY